MDCGIVLRKHGAPASGHLGSVSRPQQQFVFENLSELNTKPPITAYFMEHKLDFGHKEPISKPCILLTVHGQVS